MKTECEACGKKSQLKDGMCELCEADLIYDTEPALEFIIDAQEWIEKAHKKNAVPMRAFSTICHGLTLLNKHYIERKKQ